MSKNIYVVMEIGADFTKYMEITLHFHSISNRGAQPQVPGPNPARKRFFRAIFEIL